MFRKVRKIVFFSLVGFSLLTVQDNVITELYKKRSSCGKYLHLMSRRQIDSLDEYGFLSCRIVENVENGALAKKASQIRK